MQNAERAMPKAAPPHHIAAPEVDIQALVRHSLSPFLLAASALAAGSVAQAKIDRTTIRPPSPPACLRRLLNVKGDPGSVPGGATVTIGGGHTAATAS
ncbi:MAG: hypothetical protein JST22_01805 [Bacteroidetes bacterium]|nr:hypothetical protein [Bacteroidota bacterium]